MSPPRSFTRQAPVPVADLSKSLAFPSTGAPLHRIIVPCRLFAAEGPGLRALQGHQQSEGVER